MRNFLKELLFAVCVMTTTMVGAQNVSQDSNSGKEGKNSLKNKENTIDSKGILMYGATVIDETNPKYYVSFYSKQNGDINRLWTIDKDWESHLNVMGIRAGVWYKDAYYAYRANMYTGHDEYLEAFVKVDFAKKEVTELYKPEGAYPGEGVPWEFIYDMTLDPSHETVYGIGRLVKDGDPKPYSALYTVNMTNGALQKIADLDFYAFALASDYDGKLYAMRSAYNFTKKRYDQLELVRLDPNNGYKVIESETKVLKYEGNVIEPVLFHSMEFDHNSGDLYYLVAGQTFYQRLVKVDINTGNCGEVRSVGKNIIVGLAIPYEGADSKEAAGRVSELTCTPGENGKLEATLSWKNPTMTWKAGELKELKTIKVSRGTRNNVVATLEATGVGKAQSWTDTNPDNGFNKYYVTTYRIDNEKGLTDSITMFIGRDVPGIPMDLKLEAAGKKGTLTWKAPETGMHGAWFDKGTLTYRVVRHPGNVTVKESTKETTFTEELEERNGYYYEVTSVNKDGESEKAVSNVVAFGASVSIPYTTSLRTLDEFNVWTPVNKNNDEETWKWLEVESWPIYEGTWCARPADDYFVSPPLNLEKGKEYLVKYKYMSAAFKDTKERLGIAVGTKTDCSDFKDVHMRSDIHTIQDIFDDKCTFKSDIAGQGYVAFHVTSDAEQGWIRVSNFSIREYSDKDLAVTEINGNTFVNEGEQSIMNVTVFNNGKKTVDNYIVRLLNADTKEEIAQIAGLPVEAEKSEVIPVLWIPGEKGSINIVAEVILDGDTYPEDNILDIPVPVTIQEAGAPTWITLNKRDQDGWILPFYLSFYYNQNQVLYLEQELQNMKNIDIVGIQFAYDGKPGGEDLLDIPVSVGMMNTDLTTLTPEDFAMTGWTELFDGKISVDGTTNDCFLTILFDKPFDYTGGNLFVKLEKKGSQTAANDSNHPQWHFVTVNTGDIRRALTFRSTSSTYPDIDAVGTAWYIPFARIAYREKSSSDVKTISTMTVPAQLIGHTIYLQKTCDKVQLVSTSGAVVACAEKVSELNVENVEKGIYLLYVTTDGKDNTVKIIIK
ncbi:MAG: T9SS type A sorting domain-containing protein [Prevotella sp.]|uniref:T9SS type A sorting domain-containing protein n=1 Tax=Prevotella sp. TaxID=59823 RepID=UPI002A2F0AAF|nr:T9SS type A sorting domain-containing protein [Prevotella sp.]MDD7318218.1 T9SS type A sorting domain-containing protein [Prevotellaceae bacterium]MDY4020893.1 T9SS type A sorting domain-containing protein [Prevotella sp.]